MEFQTPQFIEEKAKIIGPLSLNQFIFFLIAAGISFIAYQFFEFFIWLIITLIVFGLAIFLAFVKINGEPSNKIILHFFKFTVNPKIYVWQRQISEKKIELTENEIQDIRKKISFSEKLNSFSLKTLVGKIILPPEEKKKDYEIVTFITGEKEKARRVDYK
jgi:hypothetical protein